MAKAIRCVECEHGSTGLYPRHGCGFSHNVGSFVQTGTWCNHPEQKRHLIFYGKTCPKTFPIKLKESK